MRKLNDADTFLYEKAALPLTYLVNMTEYFQRVRVNIHKVLLAKNKEEILRIQIVFNTEAGL